MPGKSEALAIGNVWTLGRYVYTEKQAEQIVQCMWSEDGDYHIAGITKKHADGTYNVYFLDSDVILKNVDPRDFKPIIGILSTHSFAHSISSVYLPVTHSLSPKVCN